MIIKDKLLAPYFIDMSDSMYTLIKKQEIQKDNKPTGRFSETPMGYYTSLATALDKVIKVKISERVDTMTLDTFFKTYRDMMDEFIATFKEFSL